MTEKATSLLNLAQRSSRRSVRLLVAQVLRSVAEDGDLARNEFNKAFVLMQYFGYLGRNPNDATDADSGGYNFWLNKLNQFNGNFIEAQMVKAFISSGQYRQSVPSGDCWWDYWIGQTHVQ